MLKGLTAIVSVLSVIILGFSSQAKENYSEDAQKILRNSADYLAKEGQSLVIESHWAAPISVAPDVDPTLRIEGAVVEWNWQVESSNAVCGANFEFCHRLPPFTKATPQIVGAHKVWYKGGKEPQFSWVNGDQDVWGRSEVRFTFTTPPWWCVENISWKVFDISSGQQRPDVNQKPPFPDGCP